MSSNSIFRFDAATRQGGWTDARTAAEHLTRIAAQLLDVADGRRSMDSETILALGTSASWCTRYLEAQASINAALPPGKRGPAK